MHTDSNDPQPDESRMEKDSLGEIELPAHALYGAQTQRAVLNFPISGIKFPREAIEAIAAIKSAAANANERLGLLDPERAGYIQRAADDVRYGAYDSEFPVDIFMTGSGTSFNMNANEVIANLAMRIAREEGKEIAIHPNNHVNMGQSSNDVIPSVVHIAALLELQRDLLPSLADFEETLLQKAEEFRGMVKTGRTHLMDALPIFISDEFGGWAYQVRQIIKRIEQSLPDLGRIALGGTAVGNGLNAHPRFAQDVSEMLTGMLHIHVRESDNHFASQSSMDTAVHLSGILKTYASALMKIANDIRWMNSGPNSGLREILLPALQPGSSIMPGKVNPVICEAAMQVAAQVIANDLAVTIGNERGNFQLNVMLPLIGHNLWQSIRLLANVTKQLSETTISPMTVNEAIIQNQLEKNPILITVLAPEIGYEKAATIAKRAFEERRPVIDIAREETGMDEETLRKQLNPEILAKGNKNGDIA